MRAIVINDDLSVRDDQGNELYIVPYYDLFRNQHGYDATKALYRVAEVMTEVLNKVCHANSSSTVTE